MKRKIIVFLLPINIWLLPLCMIHAQIQVRLELRMKFENDLKAEIPVFQEDPNAHVYNDQYHGYSKGIVGNALDLSSVTRGRTPVRVPALIPELDAFTIKFWVRSEHQYTHFSSIASNRINDGDSIPGWTLSIQGNGAWQWTLSDGTRSFDYTPTVKRQPINDGRWHQLAFSIDHERQKAWLYYDGMNVAIYHIGELKPLLQGLPVSIGSTATERNETKPFTGLIDEFELWSGVLSKELIQNDYLVNFPSEKPERPNAGNELRMMVWNIWHGGREHGDTIGVQRVIEVIKKADPDVIALIETYGSGPVIADALGYNFYLRSSNLSVMSRYPFGGFIDVFQPFNCGGIYVDLGAGRQVAVVNTWLHYLPDYRKEMLVDSLPAEDIYYNEEGTRYAEIHQILQELKPVIKNSKNIPVILAGDLNTPSHLDFTRKMAETHWGYIMEWPVTREIELSGFSDSFRKLHPNPAENYGGTQPSHLFDTFHYRIDYIFYQGKMLKPLFSEVIKDHPVKFPSDHNAVLTVFEIR